MLHDVGSDRGAQLLHHDLERAACAVRPRDTLVQVEPPCEAARYALLAHEGVGRVAPLAEGDRDGVEVGDEHGELTDEDDGRDEGEGVDKRGEGELELARRGEGGAVRGQHGDRPPQRLQVGEGAARRLVTALQPLHAAVGARAEVRDEGEGVGDHLVRVGVR
eukprot:scaffold89011_cov72-Phaeocystis_antarctica.AAC.2